jgi:hypothetical protein
VNPTQLKQSTFGLLAAAVASGFATTVIQAQAAARGNVYALLLILAVCSLALVGVAHAWRQET